MLIPKEVAQSIVLETEAIMDKNINFMDEQARIVASVDKGRIGDFHEGASEVLRTEKKVVISSDSSYLGAKSGINLPVRLHDQVVGVIGITGDPVEVEKLGELLQRMTEILIKEAHFEEQLELENRARETFIREWTESIFEDEQVLAARGWMFGINIYKTRVAVIIEMSDFQKHWYERIKNADIDMEEEVKLQRYRHVLERLIQHHFPEKNEHVLTSNSSSSYMILLSVNEEDSYQHRKSMVTERINDIQEALIKTYNQKSVAGVGSLYNSPREMWKSVEEADRALRFGMDNNKSFYYYEDLGVESFMYDLPTSIRLDFVERKLKPQLLKAVPEGFLTLEVFYRNEGSISRTSEALHIHKNTLQYRLKKIKDITGYDPRDINDSTLIQIALAFHTAK